MINNTVRFMYKDGSRIEVAQDKTLHVKIRDEDFLFSENNKAVFIGETDVTVIEYEGLTTDKQATHSFAKASFLPKGSSLLHYHQNLTEDYYIVSGEAQVIIDGTMHLIVAGEHIKILPRQRHQVINPSDTHPLYILERCVPAWRVEDFIPVMDATVPSSFKLR